MAIAFNAKTELATTTSEASWSLNHTCAGSDRLLVVFVSVMRSTADGIAVSTCTFGGTNMTQAATRGWNDTNRSRTYRQSIYYMVAPGTSEAAVAVTTSVNSTATVIVAVSLTGVLQSGTIGNTAGNDLVLTTAASQALTTTAANSWIVGGVNVRQPNSAATTFSPGTDTNEWYDLSSGDTAAGDISTAGGYKLVATAGASSIAWTASNAIYGVIVAVEVKAAAAGTTHQASAVDTWGAAESLSRGAIYRQTAIDYLDTAEARAARGVYRPAAVETWGLLAALTPRRTLQAAVIESMGLAGGMGPRATWRPALDELLELLEAAAGGGRIPAAAADALDVTATAGPGWTLRRVAADTWRLTDATAGRRDRRATAADGLELHESAAYPLPGGGGSLRVLPSAAGVEDMDNGSVSLSTIIGGVPGWNAFKFDNLDIPPGATIQTTSLEIWSYINDDPNLTIAAQASASPANLTEDEYNISLRPLTDSSVAWSAANVGLNQYVETPDFAEVVAAVTGLLEWEQGVSDLVLILYGTSGNIAFYSLEGSHPPYLNITWTSGGLTITAEAADLLDLLDDAERRALIAAATADSASWTAATTVALSLLLAEEWQLSETVLTLARLTVDDAALLGDGVYLTYALSLSEPLTLQVALQRIGTARAAPVDAMAYSDAMRTGVNTSAGDALALTDALAARRLLAALTADAVAYGHLLSSDILGLLDAIVQERIDLSGAATAGWQARVAVGDALAADETLATLRRFLAAAADVELLTDVAAFMKRARPTAADTAGLADALRARMGTRAAEGLAWSDATVAQLLTILRAIAADGLALDEGTAVAWRVTARDGLEFAAALATIMRWVAAVSDEWGVRGVAAFLLPNGIVRIELSMMRTRVAFEIAMPRADVALKQPAVVIEPHGLMDR